MNGDSFKVGDRISEKGKTGTIVAIHTKGTVDVMFDGMDYPKRRQEHSVRRANPRIAGVPDQEFLESLQLLIDPILSTQAKTARQLDWELYLKHGSKPAFLKDPPIKIIGIGTDKIVFSHPSYPDWVFKAVKNNYVKDEAGDERYVWEKIRGTMFSLLVAPIIAFPEVPIYAMRKASRGGSLQDLIDTLWEISGGDRKQFKNFEYYLLADANRDNIGKIDGRSVLMDYDGWYLFFTQKYDSGTQVNPSRKVEIQQMINTAPPAWKQMFKRYKLGNKPTVDKLIETVLEYTPSMRKYGDRGDADHTPPKKVRDEAMKGIILSHRHNYTSASGIGLVRAMQLVVKPKIWDRSVQRMSSYFERHIRDQESANFGNDTNPSRGYMAWLNWGGDSGKAWADNIMNKHSVSNPRKNKSARDESGLFIPAKYLKGFTGKKREARIKEIGDRREEYADALEKYGDEDDFPRSVMKKLYRPFKTDKGVKSKRSSYTEAARERGFTGSLANKAKVASAYYGGKIPVSILKEVKRKGMAAWASGGHRPGQTSHSWGEARVNSFLVGGKAFFTADNKLARELPKKVYNAIVKERVWKENPASHIALKNSFDDYSEDGMSYTELDLPHRSNDMAIIYRRNKSMRRNSALVPSMADRLPQQGKLTRKERASLPKKAFVFPSRAPGPGSYPIPNIHYAKLALNMASWSPKGKEELSEILPIVLKKYPQLKNWEHIDRYYAIAEEDSSYQMAANPASNAQKQELIDQLLQDKDHWMKTRQGWVDYSEGSQYIPGEREQKIRKKYPNMPTIRSRHFSDWDDDDFKYVVEQVDGIHLRHRRNFHHNPGYRRNMATKREDVKALRAKYREKYGNEWSLMPQFKAAYKEEYKNLPSVVAARDAAAAKRGTAGTKAAKASKAKKGSIALPGPTGYDCYPRQSNPKRGRGPRKSKTQFIEFIYGLYGRGGKQSLGATKKQIKEATDYYLQELLPEMKQEFVGDFFDRENLRQILKYEYGLQEVRKNSARTQRLLRQAKELRSRSEKSLKKTKRKLAKEMAKRKTRKPTAAECRKCHSGKHTYDSFRSAHKGMYTQKQLLRHWKQYKRKHGIK